MTVKEIFDLEIENQKLADENKALNTSLGYAENENDKLYEALNKILEELPLKLTTALLKRIKDIATKATKSN